MALSDTESFCPKDQEDWRLWLLKNHKTYDSIWLVFYKSKSKKSNLSWGQAVDEAICFGWIDSIKKTIDEDRFKQYFSQRKPNSTWSKINKQKVNRLRKENKIHPSGLKAIEISKENGSWTLLDDVEDLMIPMDLKKKFDKFTEAKNFYENLSDSMKKGVLAWIAMAKRESTRQNRIEEIIKHGIKQELPKHFQ